MDNLNRATPNAVALETTLPAMGLPPGEGLPFCVELNGIIRAHKAEPAAVGILNGRPIVGMTDDEIKTNLGMQAEEVIRLAEVRGSPQRVTDDEQQELGAAWNPGEYNPHAPGE